MNENQERELSRHKLIHSFDIDLVENVNSPTLRIFSAFCSEPPIDYRVTHITEMCLD